MQREEINARGNALNRREHLLGLIGRHDLDVGDLATTKLGELAHAHDRLRVELAFPTAAGLGVVLVFHDAHSFLSGGVTRSQSKPRPTPAGTRPGKFATPFPIFPRFACLYCDLNDSQL